MKKFIFNKVSIIVLVAMFTLGIAGTILALAPGGVTLGTADSFAVLAGAAITDTNPSVVVGNVGLSPTTGAALGIPTGEVTGIRYDVDGAGVGTTNNPALLTTAKADLSVAFNDAKGRVGATAVTASTTDSFAGVGYTLAPGVYKSASTMGVPVALTLNGGGNPNAVFIFQAGSTLNTVASSVLTLSNGAQACNVFWQVGSSATLGTGSNFKGTIMTAVSISDTGNSIVLGRLLADADNTDADSTGAVTLNNTHLTRSTCASPNLTLVKTRTNDNGGTAAPTDWTLTATGTDTISGATGSVAVTDATVAAGVYTLSESILPAGYTASTYSCVKNGGAAVISNTITLADSDDATCTINNNDNVTHLIVIKHVVGGSNVASDYSTTISGVTTGVPTAVGVESPGVDNIITTFGAYTVDEGAHVGYEKSLSADCSSTIALGETKTCTITDTYIEPSHSGGGSITYGCKDPTATNYNAFSSSKPSLCVYATIHIISTPFAAPIIPKLPKTGFPPQEKWYESLLNDILNLFR